MNHKKRVRLLAETRIKDGGEEQILRHAGYGMLELTEDHVSLEYDDRQDNDSAHIVLSGNRHKIQMVRDGTAKGMLKFVPGEETVSKYVLEFGEIDIRINTLKIECCMQETDGYIVLEYQSKMNDTGMNDTRYVCRWKS